jgi:hypothetical protein
MGLQGKLKTGGFLQNVDVLVNDINWVVGDTSQIKKGKNKGKDFTPLSVVGEFTPEGATEPTTQRLLVGNAENMTFDISDDGKDIEFAEGGVFANCEAGIFLNSCEMPEEGDLKITDFGDEDNKRLVSLRALPGVRMRLVRPINTERPEQVGKDGKSYPARDLKCAEVYSVGEAVEQTEAAAGDMAIDDQAKVALLRYLEKATGHVLPISQLKTLVSTDAAFAKSAETRKAVIGMLSDAKFLKNIDEIEYDGKRGTVTLMEVAA